jgi:hypothetical protein
MIVIGLLLILLAVGATVIALTAPATTAQVIELAALGQVSASPLAIFLAGAVSVVLLGLGVALVAQGTRRKAGRRKELRGLRKDQAAPTTAAGSTEPADGDRNRHGVHEPPMTDTTAGTTGSDTPASRNDGSGATERPNA